MAAIESEQKMATINLPAATVGVTYGDAVPVPRLVAPYRWSVSSGDLPAGVTLSTATGQLTGTPTAAGTYNFSIKVTDANAQSASADVVMSVKSVPHPSAMDTGPAPGAGERLPTPHRAAVQHTAAVGVGQLGDGVHPGVQGRQDGLVVRGGTGALGVERHHAAHHAGAQPLQ